MDACHVRRRFLVASVLLFCFQAGLCAESPEKKPRLLQRLTAALLPAHFRAVQDAEKPPVHYEHPSRLYSPWPGLQSEDRGLGRRCRPDEFRPRGYGNLFARPCSEYRLDYAPFRLSESQTQYGPAYHRNPEPLHCPNCDHTYTEDCYRQGGHCEHCSR